jgi:hypothetical protein
MLYCRDVHEYIAPTIVWFYESIPAFAIEELDSASCCHREKLLIPWLRAAGPHGTAARPILALCRTPR